MKNMILSNRFIVILFNAIKRFKLANADVLFTSYNKNASFCKISPQKLEYFNFYSYICPSN